MLTALRSPTETKEYGSPLAPKSPAEKQLKESDVPDIIRQHRFLGDHGKQSPQSFRKNEWRYPGDKALQVLRSDPRENAKAPRKTGIIGDGDSDESTIVVDISPFRRSPIKAAAKARVAARPDEY